MTSFMDDPKGKIQFFKNTGGPCNSRHIKTEDNEGTLFYAFLSFYALKSRKHINNEENNC